MIPSEKDVANFLAFAPDAGEGKAFVFLEVSQYNVSTDFRLTSLQNTNTVEEAVGQYYDNPDKYSHSSLPVPVSQPKGKGNELQAHTPPPYAPPATITSGSRSRSHMNAVIEAGNIRARDEVRLLFSCFAWSGFPAGRCLRCGLSPQT